jgi:hypothetical protein
MSELNPYEKLGVTENASFEEIQKAKHVLQQQYQDNPPVLESIETAYDTIIMQRLRLRQEGKIKVPEQIRFPDKVTPINPISQVSQNPTSAKISNWLTDLLDQPNLKEVFLQGLIFLTLITVSIFNKDTETLPLLLTFGVGTAFVILYRKDSLFWRSLGLTFSSFVVSIFVANLFFGVLNNTGLIFSITQEQFACLFTFCTLWLTSSFLR